MLKAVADEGDRQAVEDPATWRAGIEEDELSRRAALVRPKEYNGQRINATARMSAQAEPVAQLGHPPARTPAHAYCRTFFDRPSANWSVRRVVRPFVFPPA